MATKRIKRVKITQEKEIIADADVAVWVRRRGKLTRTSCIVGLEMVLAYIETIRTSRELATVRNAVAFAKEKMKEK